MRSILLVLPLSIACGGNGAAYEERITSAGVILYYDSAIDPWCGAALIRPDAVLTSARCVIDRPPDTLQFTLDDRLSPAARTLKSIAIHPQYRDGGEPGADLAIATLESPIEDVEPAEIGVDASGTLSLITAYHALRGQPFEKHLVQGTRTDGPKEMLSVRFPSLSVGCHGEDGTALYSDGRLIGVGSGGFVSRSSELGCLEVLTFVPVASRIDQLQQSLRAAGDRS